MIQTIINWLRSLFIRKVSTAPVYENKRWQWEKYNTTDTETRRMIVMSKKYMTKPMILTSPEKEEFLVRQCLSHFCRTRGLHRANLHKVAQGKRKQHKGWTARYAKTEK